MNAIGYLFGALLLAGIVIAVLWYREQKPTSLEDGIDEFHRELEALAPDWQPPVPKAPARPPLPKGGRPRNGDRPG